MEINEHINKNYIIFRVEELQKVDFSVVKETSQYTVRKSVDKSKTFINWDSEKEPWFLYLLETKEGPYTHEEMLDILATEEWTSSYIKSHYINNENNFNEF